MTIEMKKQEYENDMKQGKILFKKHKKLREELVIVSKPFFEIGDDETLNDADIEKVGRGIEIIKEIAKLIKDINVILKKHNLPSWNEVSSDLLSKMISEWNEINEEVA